MMKLFVTPKERVLAALQGQQTDRCPVINPTSIATFESMQRTGCYFPNAHVDVDKIVALAPSISPKIGNRFFVVPEITRIPFGLSLFYRGHLL